MILQELVRYYDRQRALPDSEMAPPGWVRRPLDYLIELRPDGSCANLLSRFTVEKGKRVTWSALLPAIGKQALKHTNSGKDANLLWDNASFALGWQDHRGTKLISFINTIRHWLPRSEDVGVEAVLRFLSNLAANPEGVRELLSKFDVLADFESRDPVLAFQLVGDLTGPIHFRPGVTAAYAARLDGPDDTVTLGNCLVSGLSGVALAMNETVIKNVWGAQSSGANIVSFNARAFESYGKTERQGENAPVSQRAAFAYTTALNHLLDKGSRNRVQVGDASTVFWADGASAFDGEFTLADFFGEIKDEPDRGVRAVQALYQALGSGRLPVGERDVTYFVLGLAPNAARISIRFWLQARFADLAPRILRQFDDLRVVRRFDSDPLVPSLFRLLSGLALQGKLDNVPPRLAGEWMRAILEGHPYPATLLNAAVMRCRAEQEVTYLRAAVLKAWLNRDHRKNHPSAPITTQYFKEKLDVDQTDTPYRLGRLFAVLEHIQRQAMPGINATIRDRYYNAASTTPVAVFTTLLRLKNAHLKKLSEGQTIWFERLVGEVLAPMQDFPRQLTLPQQGRFALGYYHQRQDFFTRKDTETATPNSQSPGGMT